MIRHALIIFHHDSPLVVLQADPHKTIQEQVDNYATNYAFERGHLTGTIVPALGFDAVEDLLRLLPRERLPEGEVLTRIYELRKTADIDAKALVSWLVAETDGKRDYAVTLGYTAESALRAMLDKLNIDHRHIKRGLANKYTG